MYKSATQETFNSITSAGPIKKILKGSIFLIKSWKHLSPFSIASYFYAAKYGVAF